VSVSDASAALTLAGAGGIVAVAGGGGVGGVVGGGIGSSLELSAGDQTLDAGGSVRLQAGAGGGSGAQAGRGGSVTIAAGGGGGGARRRPRAGGRGGAGDVVLGNASDAGAASLRVSGDGVLTARTPAGSDLYLLAGGDTRLSVSEPARRSR
jgi:hypothetical protein